MIETKPNSRPDGYEKLREEVIKKQISDRAAAFRLAILCSPVLSEPIDVEIARPGLFGKDQTLWNGLSFGWGVVSTLD